MNIPSAEQIVIDYEQKKDRDEEDLFMVTEALSFLISARKDPRDMMYLGSIYYERRDFDLAQKYYEMAAGYDYEPAHACLGYVYYYGRTGEPDYEKAFAHYKRSADLGNLQSAYKVADMYKNGYYVAKDEDKYAQIIEGLWPKIKSAKYTQEPFPEIAVRLAGIRAKQGRTNEAISLYMRAKDFLAQRLQYDPFFGNFTIMKGLVHDLSALQPIEAISMDFYDLYEVLKTPCTVSFYYKNKPYDVTATPEDGVPVIAFDGRYFRNIDDFMQKGTIENEPLTTVAGKFYYFEIDT